MAKSASEKTDISIAVITTDINYIKESLIKIDQRLDVMDGNYVKREELNIHKLAEEEFRKEFDKRTRDMEVSNASFQSRVTTWGAVGLIGIGIAEFLINRYV